MTKQIKRFSPHQTAKVFAVILATLTLPIAILSVFVNHTPLIFSLIILLFYPVSSYVLVTISCWLYNVMFKYIGGIEIEFNDE